MEQEKVNGLIISAAKTIFSYCYTRTYAKEEAEDLTQDIFVKLLNAKGSFISEKAFYAFMWKVAGNAYKDWYKKRKIINEKELDENISDNSIPIDELIEKESDLRLLYRELGLLTEQYRKVMIQYYFNDLKVSEIAKSLNISESMVKFLLFKSRKIMKEGMNMERVKGDLCFNPIQMYLCAWGDVSDQSFCDVCNKSLIAQNILFTCYYDRCTAEEISIQIGVAVPYFEDDLKKLCKKGVLVQKGNKYETAVVIFTKEFLIEVEEKALPIHNETAKIIATFTNEHLSEIKSIGFHTGAFDDNLLKWNIIAIIMIESVIKKYQKSINPIYPIKHAGLEVFLWGEEVYENRYSGFNGTEGGNANGDKIYFTHYFKLGGYHGHLSQNKNAVNIVLDIAKGKTNDFSENDKREVAELIKLGYVKKIDDELNLNLPVFTSVQYTALLSLLDEVTTSVEKQAQVFVNLTTDVLLQHTPNAMKKEAKNIGWIKMLDAITTPAVIMTDNNILQRFADHVHPLTYVVLA